MPARGQVRGQLQLARSGGYGDGVLGWERAPIRGGSVTVTGTRSAGGVAGAC